MIKLNLIYHVSFPNIGLDFSISPVVFKLFGKDIMWYGIILTVAVTLASLYAIFRAENFNLNKNNLSNTIIIGVFSGIVGARLYYVMFYPGDKYIRDPWSILRIDQGGIAIYGGIIAGILAGVISAKIQKLNIPATLDLAALSLLIGQAIGRWGNFVNQEAFGSPTDSVFAMMSENTAGKAVHPCFLYESFWCLLGFVLLHILSVYCRKYNGQIFLLYIVWYGFERFIVEDLRTDSLMLNIFNYNLKISQVVAAACVIVGLCLLIILRKKNDHLIYKH